MDRDVYKLWCFLGIAVALAVFFPLGAKRRGLVGLPDPRRRRVHIWLDPRDCSVLRNPNHGDR